MKFSPVDMIMRRVASKIINHAQHVNRISSIGFPCLRNLVYQRTHWMHRELPTIELQLIFNEGRNQEDAVKRDLEAAGIKVIRQEEPVWFEKEKLSGHIDGIIQFRRSLIALEIKSMSTHMFDKINSVDDLDASQHGFHRCYHPQIQLYMLGKNLRHGIILIKNKNSGAFKEIQVEPDRKMQYHYLEVCMNINAHVEQDTLPDRINDDKICGSCPFSEICLPDEIRKERIAAWIDAELEQKLTRREVLKGIRDEYERLDDEIKSKIKETDHEILNVGNFMITISRGKNTRINITKVGELNIDDLPF